MAGASFLKLVSLSPAGKTKNKRRKLKDSSISLKSEAKMPSADHQEKRNRRKSQQHKPNVLLIYRLII